MLDLGGVADREGEAILVVKRGHAPGREWLARPRVVVDEVLRSAANLDDNLIGPEMRNQGPTEFVRHEDVGMNAVASEPSWRPAWAHTESTLALHAIGLSNG